MIPPECFTVFIVSNISHIHLLGKWQGYNHLKPFWWSHWLRLFGYFFTFPKHFSSFLENAPYTEMQVITNSFFYATLTKPSNTFVWLQILRSSKTHLTFQTQNACLSVKQLWFRVHIWLNGCIQMLYRKHNKATETLYTAYR